MKRYLASLTLLALCLLLGGCAASAPESVNTVKEELTPTTVSMWVAHLTPPPAPGSVYIVLNEDPTHPTPAFTAATMVKNFTGVTDYFTNGNTAVLNLSTSDWNTMTTALQLGVNNGLWFKIQLTYDSSVAGNQKPLIGTPSYFVCNGVGLSFGPNCG